MTKADIEAIVGGYHGDPFGILGAHSLRKKAGRGRWEVRAFLPHAESAEVVIGDIACPMAKRHPQGFFVALLEDDIRPYRLRATLYQGGVTEFDDPYRFPPQLTSFELYLHAEGTNYESYNTLGAHLVESEGVSGTRFAVWAPNAQAVSVAGDFNQWDTRRHPMRQRDGGIWEILLPGVGEGAAYKYYIRSRLHGYQQWKADPYAFYCETPPKSASVVHNIDKYQWQDSAWMDWRATKDWLRSPMSVYEVHLESWLRAPNGAWLTYRELAVTLTGYVKRMGYSHIELLPMMEHPFSGSWGYQVVGYYAPTSRFGTPEDFMYFIDRCHQEGIGVIIDWVPAHFPKDAHGLGFFDGSALYEHEDPRLGEHRDWGTLIFNYGRTEVREFLIANALFWLRKYHIDGLRVDAVASMLYLDYSRKEGEWVPNKYGGNENLEALEFIRRFNELAHTIPGAFTIAEESTAFAGVSRPVYLNGLGFTLKWNMGWMHDMLHYFQEDPLNRKFHHNDITFSLLYAFTENFLLPISHDEVVHGKRSLINKMPGDEWQRFANARAFLAYMYGHPGKKLLFMGSEIGQYEEWSNASGVHWELLQYDYHHKLQTMVAELNRFYLDHPAMYEVDFHHAGFEWVDFRDSQNSVIAFLRRPRDPGQFLMFCCNFTPVVRERYEFPVPEAGFYEEVFNTDWERFGGSGQGNAAGAASEPLAGRGGRPGISITLPPLAVVAFRRRA